MKLEFIGKAKKKVLVMIATMIMIISGILGIPEVSNLSLATSSKTDTTAPVVSANERMGRVKAGSKLTFTFTDDSELDWIYYQWDAFGKYSEAGPGGFSSETASPGQKTFTTTVPSTPGVHDFRIAASDKSGNIGNWKQFSYYVVSEDVPEDYTETTHPAPSFPPSYPTSKNPIDQEQEITINLYDENGIYWFRYEWRTDLDIDPYTEPWIHENPTYITEYNPGNQITVKAPKVAGEYWFRFYIKDTMGNACGTYYTRITVKDSTKPTITLNGSEYKEVLLGDQFEDEGATWVDETDGTGIIKSQDTVDVNKVGTYTLTYSYTDKSGNTSETLTRTVSVVSDADFIEPDKKNILLKKL